MTTRSKTLTIFEGPDGGGKSTLALAYATAIGARYVHFGPLPQVGRGLARMYVEAMLPALLGYQDVVFDRSWLSELPYGNAFRGGRLRLGLADVRMLERVAMRCDAAVVLCLPDVETCLATFRARRGKEMLEREDQLRQVYMAYVNQLTALRTTYYDRDRDRPEDVIQDLLEYRAQHPPRTHRLAQPTAGNRLARVCIVGENFAEVKDLDPLIQHPFVSFSGAGCSRWLAEYLAGQGICESQLSWANADLDLTRGQLDLAATEFVALGAVAGEALDRAGRPYCVVPHPQHQRRFNHHEDYDLGRAIRAALDRSMAKPDQAAAGARACRCAAWPSHVGAAPPDHRL